MWTNNAGREAREATMEGEQVIKEKERLPDNEKWEW